MVNSRDAASLLRKGIFAVNKMKDYTSAEVLNRLREITLMGLEPENRPHTLRMGHGGTLDKGAVGVLVVGVNWGCKNLPLLLGGSKNYIVVGQLGIATDTFNETGRVIDERPYAHVRENHIEQVLPRFVGETWQTSPLYSTLKINSKRMSEYAREGIDLTPKERRVRCYSVECTDFNPPFFTLHLRCSGEFYVRSLVHDIGLALSTCAHVRQLQRTQQGPFTLQDCLHESEWTVENILDSILRCNFKFVGFTNRQKNAFGR